MFSKTFLTRTPIYFVTILVYILYGSFASEILDHSGLIGFIPLLIVFVILSTILDLKVEQKAKEIYGTKKGRTY